MNLLNELQLKKIRTLISYDKEPGNLFRTLAYIVEETGELSEALQDKSHEEQLRETLDVIISANAMYLSLNGGEQFASKHINEQLRKWRLKLGIGQKFEAGDWVTVAEYFEIGVYFQIRGPDQKHPGYWEVAGTGAIYTFPEALLELV